MADLDASGALANGSIAEAATRRTVRGPGFKPEESLALVRAWKVITLDPITGADQAGSKFWD